MICLETVVATLWRSGIEPLAMFWQKSDVLELVWPTLKRRDLCTLPKTNIAPEHRPSQKETSIPTIHFQVLC